ncbi:peptide ligase PGM1-related protein [Nocardiopsis sp. NPDC101807]|uniref:preATP grasp domain-containing protein n=1 Tax=Nocardiopsis sp. NPDC101807 TaxID=3364339 RepID=UPI00380B75A9
MTALIVVNVPEEMVGDIGRIPVEKRRAFGLGAQRMLWYAEDGDVLVLPSRPSADFMDYVTGLTGTRASTLRFVIPPPGRFGPDILTADRLVDPVFLRDLEKALADRPVDRITCTYSDLAVTAMASAVGVEEALPGHAFSAQGGDALVNSKAVFRAVAAGNGIPVAPGVITDSPDHAEGTIESLLADGAPVMVKQQFAGGGLGNEILSRAEGVRAAGAAGVVVLADRDAVRRYVRDRWEWLTGHKGHSLIIERYFPDSTTVYAEFVADDDGCVFRGAGEILMEPVATGEVIPPQSVGPGELAELVETGRRACEPFRLMGYRGTLCADAIRTPEGGLVFTEVNGRLTASSHLHVNLIDRVVGRDRRDGRVFLERAGRWAVPSFAEALSRLGGSGLGYDPHSGLGVVVTADYAPVTGRVTYCAVAEDLDAARALEERVANLLSDPTA